MSDKNRLIYVKSWSNHVKSQFLDVEIPIFSIGSKPQKNTRVSEVTAFAAQAENELLEVPAVEMVKLPAIKMVMTGGWFYHVLPDFLVVLLDFYHDSHDWEW